MSDPSERKIQPPDDLKRLSKSLVTHAYTEGYRQALSDMLASLPALHGLSGSEVLCRLDAEMRYKGRTHDY